MPFANRPQDQEDKEGRILPSAEQSEVLAHKFYGKPEDEERSEKILRAKDDEARDEPEVEGHRFQARPDEEKDAALGPVL